MSDARAEKKDVDLIGVYAYLILSIHADCSTVAPAGLDNQHTMSTYYVVTSQQSLI